MFASASVTPRSSAQRVACTPAKPTIAFSTMSGSQASRSVVGRATNLHVLDTVCGSERYEGPGARHQGAQLELGALLHDLDRLTADRAGCTEQSDALHECRVPEPKRGHVSASTT